MCRRMNDRVDHGWVPPFPPGLLSLLAEVGELKRVRSAGRPGSIAERLFADGWRWLLAGSPSDQAMRAHVGRALAAARLGDIDAPVLLALGLDERAADGILDEALAEAGEAVSPPLLARLTATVPVPEASLPDFVARLAAQPRAGVTCPGRPRLIFEPVENHAEHCAVVAVFGALLAPLFGASPAVVWLAAMAHHFHNAFLPDSGWAGEVLLGAHLEPLMARATALCLEQLPPALAAEVAAARTILPDAGTPEGRAFQAADTLDRVWQIEQHLRPGRIGLDFVLRDMALVHDGPAKPFQDAVLRSAGLPA